MAVVPNDTGLRDLRIDHFFFSRARGGTSYSSFSDARETVEIRNDDSNRSVSNDRPSILRNDTSARNVGDGATNEQYLYRSRRPYYLFPADRARQRVSRNDPKRLRLKPIVVNLSAIIMYARCRIPLSAPLPSTTSNTPLRSPETSVYMCICKGSVRNINNGDIYLSYTSRSGRFSCH